MRASPSSSTGSLAGLDAPPTLNRPPNPSIATIPPYPSPAGRLLHCPQPPPTLPRPLRLPLLELLPSPCLLAQIHVTGGLEAPTRPRESAYFPHRRHRQSTSLLPVKRRRLRASPGRCRSLTRSPHITRPPAYSAPTAAARRCPPCATGARARNFAAASTLPPGLRHGPCTEACLAAPSRPPGLVPVPGSTSDPSSRDPAALLPPAPTATPHPQDRHPHYTPPALPHLRCAITPGAESTNLSPEPASTPAPPRGSNPAPALASTPTPPPRSPPSPNPTLPQSPVAWTPCSPATS